MEEEPRVLGPSGTATPVKGEPKSATKPQSQISEAVYHAFISYLKTFVYVMLDGDNNSLQYYEKTLIEKATVYQANISYLMKCEHVLLDVVDGFDTTLPRIPIKKIVN